MIYPPVHKDYSEWPINDDPHQHFVDGRVCVEYSYTSDWEEETRDTDNGPGTPGYYTFDDIIVTKCQILIWINPVVFGYDFDFMEDPAGREAFELDSNLAEFITIEYLDRRPAFRKALVRKINDYLESKPASYFE